MSPEDYFRIDQYDDFSRTAKPIVYISQEEIYSTHALLLENLDELAKSKDDPLQVILSSLGTPPEGSAEATTRGAEMSLNLTNRFANVQQEDTAFKTLYVQTKRYVLSIIRVQQGDNLLHILEKPATANEEKVFALQQEKEAAQNKQREGQNQSHSAVLGIAKYFFFSFFHSLFFFLPRKINFNINFFFFFQIV